VAASAHSKTTVIALDQSCDKFDVTVTKDTAGALDAPSCAATFGGGIVGKKDGALTLGLQDPSQPGVQFILELSYPLTDGGTFSIYQTTDGVRLQDMQDGHYSVETDPRAEVPLGNQRPSVFHH
jgi:hypothetical protein